MMWAFSSPSKLPADLDVVRDASEEVHVAEDDDEPQRFKGKAARWNPRGFGFIKPMDGGEDLFCHSSAITDGNVLREGDIVDYAQEYDDRTGKYKAIDVTGGQREEGQVAQAKKQRPAPPELKKGKEEIQLKRGVNIVAMPGGGDVGGSSSYKISNREATRDMDWLCAISSMEGESEREGGVCVCVREREREFLGKDIRLLGCIIVCQANSHAGPAARILRALHAGMPDPCLGVSLSECCAGLVLLLARRDPTQDYAKDQPQAQSGLISASVFAPRMLLPPGHRRVLR
jgi:cold shock CspA family protein